MARRFTEDFAKSRAADRGATAAAARLPYDQNPYDRAFQPQLHLAWSEAHNGMRAHIILNEEGR